MPFPGKYALFFLLLVYLGRSVLSVHSQPQNLLSICNIFLSFHCNLAIGVHGNFHCALTRLEGSLSLGFFSSKMQSISALPSSVQYRRLLEDRGIVLSSAPISPSAEIPESSAAVTYVAKASFDSSLAIILAAFLCSIICALGVSVMIRCRLLCRRWRVVSEPGTDAGVGEVKGSICREIDIKALPATVYHTAGSAMASMDCPICLEEFMEGENVRVLPECSHSFHLDCIDTWLVSNPSCPSCRHSLLYVMVKKSSGVAQRNVNLA